MTIEKNMCCFREWLCCVSVIIDFDFLTVAIGVFRATTNVAVSAIAAAEKGTPQGLQCLQTWRTQRQGYTPIRTSHRDTDTDVTMTWHLTDLQILHLEQICSIRNNVASMRPTSSQIRS